MDNKGWGKLYRPYRPRRVKPAPHDARLTVREADAAAVTFDVLPMTVNPDLCMDGFSPDMPVFSQMWMCNAQCPKSHAYYRSDLQGCSRTQCAMLDVSKCKQQQFQNFCKAQCDVVLTDAVNIKGTSPSMPVVKRTKTF